MSYNLCKIFLAFTIVFALTACGRTEIIDARNQSAFSASVTEIAGGLTDSEKYKFFDDLSKVAQAQGDSSLEKVSLQTLALLNGKNKEQVKNSAYKISLLNRRDVLEALLNINKGEIEKLAKQQQYSANEQERNSLLLAKLKNIEVVPGAVAQSQKTGGGVSVSLKVRNSNEVAATLMVASLKAISLNGATKEYEGFTTLGIGLGCLYGQRVEAGATVTIDCSLTVPFAPDTKYEVRIDEARFDGMPIWLTRPSTASGEKETQLDTALEQLKTKRAQLAAEHDAVKRQLDALL